MEYFSNIENIEKTGKDHLINQMVDSTGLSKERVEKLYENFAMLNNNDIVKINENFTDLLSEKMSSFEFSEFKDKIVGLSASMVKHIDNSSRARITGEIIKTISLALGMTLNVGLIVEVMCFVLMMKSKHFSSMNENADLSGAISNTDKFDFYQNNVDKRNTSELNLINAKNDVMLYESLREILTKNDKHWGITHHLDNAYVAIVDYLDKEIIELTNFQNIHTVEDNFHLELFNQIVTQEQLNPMYRSVDVLRKLIPDIQTLVFDCIALTHTYIARNQEAIQFLDRKTYGEYLEVTKTLFSAIHSSSLTSKICFKDVDTGDTSEYNQVFRKMQIDQNKLDIYTYPIRVHSAVDMVHIVKSCETEFNLRLRKVINNYVTKTLNLLASTEKVLNEQRKSNKFKNGYL